MENLINFLGSGFCKLLIDTIPEEVGVVFVFSRYDCVVNLVANLGGDEPGSLSKEI